MRRSFSLRNVTPSDNDFLFRVYASTRADEMKQLPWNSDQQEMFLKMQYTAQQQDYLRRFPDGEHKVIVMGGEPAGRLYLARCIDEIRILDIALLPEHRNKGVGRMLIDELIQEASQTRRPLRIYIEQNSSALRLFERLGFSNVQDIGSHFLFEWRA